MSVKASFKFALSVLTQEGDYILDAAAANAAAGRPKT